MSTNELLYQIMTASPRSRGSLLVKDDRIDEALKQVTGYHTTDLQKKDGRREMTVPRQIGMFFYLRAGYSLAQSAMRFHRDHSNAVYARYQIMNLYGQVNERKLTEFVDAIERITGIESGLRVNTFTAVNEPTEVNI